MIRTTNGDDFPVTGGFPLPSDIDDCKPKYKFVLVNDQTGEHIQELDTLFVPDDEMTSEGYEDCPNVWSSMNAYAKALGILGYNVKVVKA